MLGSKSKKVAIACTVLGLGPLLVSSPVGADASVASARLTLVSGPDPLPTVADPTHCGSAAGTGPSTDRSGWEEEPNLAVNPGSGSQLVGAWIQDWSDAISVGYSTDGGGSWHDVVPPTSICTPGGSPNFNGGATDPWVAWASPSASAPNGIVYVTAAVGGSQEEAEVVNRSLDGGRTWSQPGVAAPIILDTPPNGYVIDGSDVVTDPHRPNNAYAMWRRADTAAATRTEWMAYTTDGGLTWSAPTQVPVPTEVFAGHLLVLGDGSLLAVTSAIPNQPVAPATGVDCPTGPTTFYVSRLTDLHGSWSAPVAIPEPDPDSGLTWSAVTVAPNGAVYVAWQHTYRSAAGPRLQIRYSTSPDSGSSWGAPGVVADVPGAPELGATSGTWEQGTFVNRCSTIWAAPSITVTHSGTIAVGFFDHRNDPQSNPGRITDYWLVSSKTGGATWQSQHVTGSFDQATAPSQDGAQAGDGSNGPGFLGDYQGMTAVGDSLGLLLSLASPLPGATFALTHPPTDIFFTRLST